MVAHGGLGAVAVAPFEPGEERLVLLKGQEFPAGHVDAGPMVHGKPVEDAPAYGREERVAGEFGDGGVEFAVESDEVRPASDRCPAVLQHQPQARQAVRGRPLRRDARDAALEGEPRLLEMLQRVAVGGDQGAHALGELFDDGIRSQPDHLGPLALTDLQSAETFEGLQRLADHGPRHAEDRRQLALRGQPRSDWEVSREDRLQKLISDLLVKSTTNNRSEVGSELHRGRPSGLMVRPSGSGKQPRAKGRGEGRAPARERARRRSAQPPPVVRGRAVLVSRTLRKARPNRAQAEKGG